MSPDLSQGSAPSVPSSLSHPPAKLIFSVSSDTAKQTKSPAGLPSLTGSPNPALCFPGSRGGQAPGAGAPEREKAEVQSRNRGRQQ